MRSRIHFYLDICHIPGYIPGGTSGAAQKLHSHSGIAVVPECTQEHKSLWNYYYQSRHWWFRIVEVWKETLPSQTPWHEGLFFTFSSLFIFFFFPLFFCLHLFFSLFIFRDFYISLFTLFVNWICITSLPILPFFFTKFYFFHFFPSSTLFSLLLYYC